jgi:hypothetical protein
MLAISTRFRQDMNELVIMQLPEYLANFLYWLSLNLKLTAEVYISIASNFKQQRKKQPFEIPASWYCCHG